MRSDSQTHAAADTASTIFVLVLLIIMLAGIYFTS
jgi:Na+/H+ antiporter NhaB